MSSGNSVVFNGVEIRYLDLRLDEAGVFSRIHIAFNPSQPVMEAMGWDPWPDSIPRGPLTGRLAATHLILTPTDKKLKQHEMQFAINEVKDFSFTSETNDEGHIIARTIRATVASGEAVEAQIGNWLRVIGQASAVAKIGYTVQQKLPGADPVVDDKQKVISFQKEQREADGSTDGAENAGLNNVNAAGSGREKKKSRRGAAVESALVSIDKDDREKLEQQIAADSLGEVH